MTVPPTERTERAAGSSDEAAFSPADWGRFFAISLVWGSSFLFISVALESFEPGLVTFGRVALGAVVLGVSLRVSSRDPVRIAPADRPRLVLLSVIWVALPFTLFPIAEQHINSAVTGMLNGSTPIFAAVATAAISRRRPGATRVLGLSVGLAGVVLISLGQAGEGDRAVLGIVLVLLASLCYGVAANLAVPLQQRYGSLVLMSRMLALAVLWTAPNGLLSLDGSSWSASSAAGVAVIGVLGTGVAFVMMGTLVGSVGATRASLITYLIPVVALGLGVSVQDDRVTSAALVGVALVVAGALLAAREERPLPTPIRPRH